MAARAVPSIERGKSVFLEGVGSYGTRQLTRAEAISLRNSLDACIGPDPVANRYRVTVRGKVYPVAPEDIDLGDDAHDWIGRDKGQAFVWAVDEVDALNRANALRAAGSASKADFLASIS